MDLGSLQGRPSSCGPCPVLHALLESFARSYQVVYWVGRLAYETRLWAQVASPDALCRYFRAISGPLAVATVVAVTALAMTVGRRCPGRPLRPGRGRAAHRRPRGVARDGAAKRHRAGRLGALAPPLGGGPRVSFGLLLLGFGALVLAVLSERYPRDRSLGPVPLTQPRLGLDRRPGQLVLLGPGTELSVTDATPGTRFLLMTGQPYGEAPIFNRPYMD